MTRRRTIRAVAVATGLVLAGTAVTACSDGDPTAGRRASSIEVLLHGSDTGPLPVASDALVAQLASARGLRLGLRQLLIQHTLLVGEVLERTQDAGSDLAAASQALADNTDALVSAIGVVYGEAGARAFHELWAQHAQFLVEYAIAAADGDRGARETARDTLGQHHQDFAAFCNLATGLPEDAVHQLVGGHLDDLLARADAIADGNGPAALAATLRGLAEVVTIADALASAITAQHPDIFGGEGDDAVTESAAAIIEELGVSEATAVATAGPLGSSGLSRATAKLDREAVFDPSVRAILADLDSGLAAYARSRGGDEQAFDKMLARTVADAEQWADSAGLDAGEVRVVGLVTGAHVRAVAERIRQAADPAAAYDSPIVAAAPLALALAEGSLRHTLTP